MSGGNGLKVFVTDFGKVAISICYDSGFPLLARNQVEQGADPDLVPSCTDTLAGFHRVKIGCQALACLRKPVLCDRVADGGRLRVVEAVDTNVGVATVYTPVDRGFPANGVLAGKLNQPQWVYAELDMAAVARVRDEGQVFNHRDWAAQWPHVR